MTNFTTKISTARRKGDAYEMHLLALQCLRMLVEPTIQHVMHEYRPALPADDVFVESTTAIDCYQSKHAADPHALLTFDDLVNNTDLGLTVDRLSQAWERLNQSGKEVRIHLFTNRAADSELAKILDRDRIAEACIEDRDQKRLRARLKNASGIVDEDAFKAFLHSLRFDLRQDDLNQLRLSIQQEWLQHRLGLDPSNAYNMLLVHVEQWYLEQYTRPISRDEVLQALRIDSHTLPQTFRVDRRSYVPHTAFAHQVDALLDRIQNGYIVVIGPPGSGKSTFLTDYTQKRERRQQPVIRYYCFTEVNDPLFLQRVSANAFLKSMHEQLRRQFGHVLPTEGRYDYSAERFYDLLVHLGQWCQAQGTTLLMVVDGLDHVERVDLESTKKLLRVLPTSLPPGVICLMGTQGVQYLPPAIERQTRGERQLTLPLFNAAQTTQYLRRIPRLRSRLTSRHIARLHQRSEGLPLYLHYIGEQLITTTDERLDVVIANVPSYNGHIDRYYGHLWDAFRRDPHLRHLAGLVARLRFRVQTAELFRMVGVDAFTGNQALQRVHHLLDITEVGCRIFHNSFRDFIQLELTGEELRQLDREILVYLDRQRGSTAWFAHACKYAVSAGDDSYLLDAINANYVDDAIQAGRSRQEILETLYLGVSAAARQRDLVVTARLATLTAHTKTRLEQHIDNVQLQRSLFALGDTEAALAAVAYEGHVYDTSATTAAMLIELAYQGRAALGAELARTFLEKVPRRLNSVDMIQGWGEILAVYDEAPASRLAKILVRLQDHLGTGLRTEGPRIDFLRRVLRHLYFFRRHEVRRSLWQLLIRKDFDQSLREEWWTQTALLEAEHAPTTALHHVIAAERCVQDVTRRTQLAGIAARLDGDRALIEKLLGDYTLVPSLRNDALSYSSGATPFVIFRSYVAALVACGRDTELHALQEYMQGANTWAAVYYGANLNFSRRQTSREPERLLESLDSIIRHRKRDNERVFEVFWSLRADFPHFIEEVIDGYMAAGGTPDPLIDRLQQLGESELISFRYGIGFTVADYKDELTALAHAARYPALRLKLQPLLVALHDKIFQQTLETTTRANHFLRLAEAAVGCGYPALAKQWLQEGLQASRGYGSHKDITLALLIDAMSIVNQRFPERAKVRMADVAYWNLWLRHLTDGDETKWFHHQLFDVALTYDFAFALRLLLTYRVTIAHWKFSDCLVKLLEAYAGDNPGLAYVLSEVVEECTDDGYEDKFGARQAVLKHAARNEASDAVWIAERLRTFLLCEVSPDRRYPLTTAYNQTAAVYGLPLITPENIGTPSKQRKDEREERTSVELDGQILSRDDLMERMTESIDTWIEWSARLRDTNQIYTFSAQVDAARDQLLAQVTLLDDVHRFSAVLTKITPTDARAHTAIAEAYRHLGDEEHYLAHYRQAFQSVHSWGLWDKHTEYLAPLVEHRPDEALQLLLDIVKNQTLEFGGFGAATLLVRSLDLFGPAYNDAIMRIYEETHEFIGTQFTHLPSIFDNPYTWMHEEPFVPQPFDEAALSIILDEWKEPATHRRVALTHLLRDLALQQPDHLLPHLVSALGQEDRTLRIQAALVLNSVALVQPELLCGYVLPLTHALDIPHIEVTEYILSTLQHIRTKRAIPVEAERRITTFEQPISTKRSLELPYLAPSAHFRSAVLPRAGDAVVEVIEKVVTDLDLDINEIYWRIERHMERLGYDREVAEEEYRDRWGIYAHPQGPEEGVIPFEPYAQYFLRHAFAEVMDQLSREQGWIREARETIYRHVRLYDPSFPWRWITPKPAELTLPYLDERYDTTSLTDELEAWLQFQDISALSTLTLPLSWITVCDFYFHSHGRLQERSLQTAYLVSREHADLIRAGRQHTGVLDTVLHLAPESLFHTVSIQEAQHLFAISRFSENPRWASVIPLMALHVGAWWHMEQYAIAGLAGPWISKYQLTWSSPHHLHMLRGETEVARFDHWRDGYVAGTYRYIPVGSGTRLRLSSDFLQAILAEYNLELVVNQSLTRTVGRARYGTQHDEREEQINIVRLFQPRS